MRGKARLCGWLICAFILLAGGFYDPAPATGQEAAVVRDQLNRLNQDIEKARRDKENLQGKVTSLEQEHKILRRDLINLAADLQNQEETNLRLQGQLVALETEYKRRQSLILDNQDKMMQITTGLARIDANDPISLLLYDGPPRNLMLGAFVSAALLPLLSNSAESLKQDMQTLTVVNNNIRQKLDDIKQNETRLAQNQRKLESLLSRNRALIGKTSADRKRLETELASLVKKASSMEELVASLGEFDADALPKPRQRQDEVTGLRDDEEIDISRPARRQGESLTATPDEAAMAALAFEKPEAVRPFPKRGRGKLANPVIGQVITKYGEDTKFGITARGIYIEARPSAQIIAPYDGKVVFAGSFLEYGLVAIIEHEGGYYSVLGGFAQIDAFAEQWLLAGEPLGRLPETGLDQSRPTLYVELRHQRETLDPLLWYDSRKFASR